jgi:hypothetical protein
LTLDRRPSFSGVVVRRPPSGETQHGFGVIESQRMQPGESGTHTQGSYRQPAVRLLLHAGDLRAPPRRTECPAAALGSPRPYRGIASVYTQASNRRHGRNGRLFQGRFKDIVVDRDAYLLELTRDVVLNPVRAGMVEAPQQWPWSSYGAMMGTAPAPSWLASC